MLLTILLCTAGVLIIIFLLPLKGAHSFPYQAPVHRIHEADAVLSRRLLIPDSSSYHSYYQKNPQFREADDRSREAPGLLNEKATNYDPGTFAAAKANFELIEFLGALTHGPDATKKRAQSHPDKYSRFIREWLQGTGAHQVGYTRLHDYHLYSHKGRGNRSGEVIEKKHSHAIAITVEMSHRMMQSAPLGSSVMESSEQYLRSGVLALKLAHGSGSWAMKPLRILMATTKSFVPW